MWYVVDLSDEGNLSLLHTCVRRGASDTDRLAWRGIVNCPYKTWSIHHMCVNDSTEPITNCDVVKMRNLHL